MAIKLLILTQYFPPETGAAQNRLLQLATQLKRLDVEITVLTAMPNYPTMRIFDGYRNKWYHFEVLGGIPVHRCWIYSGTSKSIIPRLFNYFSFVKTSFLTGLFKIEKQDYIFCESPPLFLGISAWCLSKIKRAKLIFNVSDLWPESAEKLGLVTNKALLGISTILEEFLYRSSVLITGQTQGIVKNIANRFPDKRVLWLKNGVVAAEINQNLPDRETWRMENGFRSDDFLVIYAGIIGHAQGLEVIIKAAALLKTDSKIKFLLVGSGPVKDQLISLQQETGAGNVIFYPNRLKTEVLGMVNACNVSVIPLKKLDLFKGAIPSKIFENLALKKPILLGVEGEAKEIFIDQGNAGCFFEPENETDLADKVKFLAENPQYANEAGLNGHTLLAAQFDPVIIAREFFQALLRLQPSSKRTL
jgi:glycosyltransferase involved in cell wall biosynthesis